jgi:hypothetical protein
MALNLEQHILERWNHRPTRLDGLEFGFHDKTVSHRPVSSPFILYALLCHSLWSLLLQSLFRLLSLSHCFLPTRMRLPSALSIVATVCAIPAPNPIGPSSPAPAMDQAYPNQFDLQFRRYVALGGSWRSFDEHRLCEAWNWAYLNGGLPPSNLDVGNLLPPEDLLLTNPNDPGHIVSTLKLIGNCGRLLRMEDWLLSPYSGRVYGDEGRSSQRLVDGASSKRLNR